MRWLMKQVQGINTKQMLSFDGDWMWRPQPLGYYFVLIILPASLNLSDCTCPEECNTYSYSLQQSAASLALLGVRQLLDSITPDVKRSYYRALDMNDRMEPEHFYKTLNLLEGVLNKIEGKDCT